MRPVDRKIIELCKRGRTIDEVALACGVSDRTVDRAIKRYRDTGQELVLVRGRPASSVTKKRAYEKRTIVRKEFSEEQVDAIVHSLKDLSFPLPDRLSDDKIEPTVRRLRELRTFVRKDGVLQPRSPIGVRLCSPFFPNRFRASASGNPSAFDAWRDEERLRDAIRFLLRYGQPTDARAVARALTSKCRTPSIFRPGVATYIYRRFCPRGGVVWDPCAGYGGRLLGAHAAEVHYVATDVEPETIEGNRALGAALGANCSVVESPAEDFVPPPVDLVFTSPPYFDRERYSENAEQSWKKHPTPDAWMSGFMLPVIRRAHNALRSGGHLIINVADGRDERSRLVQRVVDAASGAGFVHVETLLMPLAALNRWEPTEPILVFRVL